MNEKLDDGHYPVEVGEASKNYNNMVLGCEWAQC